MIALLLALALGGSIDVSAVTPSRPRAVADLDLSRLRGDIRRLAWSPEGTSLYVQTVDRDTAYDYIVTLPDGVVSAAFGEPEWAVAYWAYKSRLSAPDDPTIKIEVAQSSRRTRPAPFAGGFANGGAQTPDPKNPVDAYESEITLRLLGEEIGNWINADPIAGESFGWGPEGSRAIVFADAGRVVVFDRQKRKKVIAAANATMPAWSRDGKQIVYLEKNGRRKYRVMLVDIRWEAR